MKHLQHTTLRFQARRLTRLWRIALGRLAQQWRADMKRLRRAIEAL